MSNVHFDSERKYCVSQIPDTAFIGISPDGSPIRTEAVLPLEPCPDDCPGSIRIGGILAKNWCGMELMAAQAEAATHPFLIEDFMGLSDEEKAQRLVFAVAQVRGSQYIGSRTGSVIRKFRMDSAISALDEGVQEKVRKSEEGKTLSPTMQAKALSKLHY